MCENGKGTEDKKAPHSRILTRLKKTEQKFFDEYTTFFDNDYYYITNGYLLTVF